MLNEEGVDKHPGDADSDEHGEEDEGEHESPGRAFMMRRSCLGLRIFFGVGHLLVYGADYYRGVLPEVVPKIAAKSPVGSNTNLLKWCLNGAGNIESPFGR